MIKKSIACLICYALISTASCRNISDLPAMMLQITNTGYVDAKYAKVKTEERYGIWIAFDNVNDEILYDVTLGSEAPSAINIYKIMYDIKQFIQKNKEHIKTYLQDMIHLEEAKYYLNTLYNHIMEPPFVTLGGLSDMLLQELKKKADDRIKDDNTQYIKVGLEKYIREASANLESCVASFKRNYNLCESNAQKIDHLFESFKQYNHKHPFFKDENNKYADANFEIHKKDKYYYNPHFCNTTSCDTTSCDTTCSPNEGGTFTSQQEKPYILEVATSINLFRKKTHKNSINSEYNMLINQFVYLPPTKSQYEDSTAYKPLEQKLENIDDFLKTIKRNTFLKDGAGEFAKEKVDELLTKVRYELRKHQDKLNAEIDKFCANIKNMFSKP